MSFIRKYRLIIIVIVPLIVLVLIRAFGTNHFTTDAAKQAEGSFDHSNIITIDKIGELKGDILAVQLGKDVIKHIPDNLSATVIPPDSILAGRYINLIKNHTGPVILMSEDLAVSSRIWMFLSQMGFEKLYVLSQDPEPEALKHEFRPDTTARPEF
jgi:hypothetical protein